MRVACECDELAAHVLIRADQSRVRHIPIVEGADSGGVDLERDILFDDSAEDIKDLLSEGHTGNFKTPNMQSSFLY